VKKVALFIAVVLMAVGLTATVAPASSLPSSAPASWSDGSSLTKGKIAPGDNCARVGAKRVAVKRFATRGLMSKRPLCGGGQWYNVGQNYDQAQNLTVCYYWHFPDGATWWVVYHGYVSCPPTP